MKFLIDECVSKSIFNFLKDNFDTKHVQDLMPGASDDEVLRIAVTENRVIVTRDKDFGDMVFRDKKQHLGVILLRLQIKHPANQVAVLKRIINDHFFEITGNFIIATDASIKVIKIVFH
jgi:predicted nuclease of predicted toxin-antitoxin system